MRRCFILLGILLAVPLSGCYRADGLYEDTGTTAPYLAESKAKEISTPPVADPDTTYVTTFGSELETGICNGPLRQPKAYSSARPLGALPSGTSGVHGVLFNLTTNTPLSGTIFYLTPGRGKDGREAPVLLTQPRVDKGDIVSVTGDSGEFMVQVVSPGNYFVMVWAPMDWRLASGDDQGVPLLLTLEPDMWHDLGVVSLFWP